MKKYFLLCVTVLLLSMAVTKNIFAQKDAPANEAPTELDWTLDATDLSDFEKDLDDIPLDIIEQEDPKEMPSISFEKIKLFLGIEMDNAKEHISNHKIIYSLLASGISVFVLALLIWIIQKP